MNLFIKLVFELIVPDVVNLCNVSPMLPWLTVSITPSTGVYGGLMKQMSLVGSILSGGTTDVAPLVSFLTSAHVPILPAWLHEFLYKGSLHLKLVFLYRSVPSHILVFTNLVIFLSLK